MANNGTPISIRIDADLRAALEREAIATNRTLAGIVRHVLREHVEALSRTPAHPQRP